MWSLGWGFLQNMCPSKTILEALILASTNPKYDMRLCIELHVKYIHENCKLSLNLVVLGLEHG